MKKDYTSKIIKTDNTKYLIKASNANLRGKAKMTKDVSEKPYVLRRGKKALIKEAANTYDKAVNAVYGDENQTQGGAGEQTLASFGTKKKHLSKNIQNLTYYNKESRMLYEKRKPYKIAKAPTSESKAAIEQNHRNRIVKKNKHKLKDHSGIIRRKNLVPAVPKQGIRGKILTARSFFTKEKIIVATATSAVPVLICVLILVMIVSSFKVCPIDAHSSKASELYYEISEWEADYKVKHTQKDEDGETYTWYEWPYLDANGTTVDRAALLAYITAKFPFLEEEKSNDAKSLLRDIYDNAISENLHNNIQGYLDKHRDELFEGTEYNEYQLYLDDEYILYRCYGPPLKNYEWQNYITSHMGWRMHPTKGEPLEHKGTDIACPDGTEVISIMSCEVLDVNLDPNKGERGIYVKTRMHIDRGALRQDINIDVIYQHLSKALVEKGQKISRGDIIALSGHSGIHTGPHLHIEIIKNSSEYISAEIVCERK